MQDDSITIELGLPGLRIVAHKEREEWHEVLVEYRATRQQCPRCSLWTSKLHSCRDQPKRDMGLRDKPVWLVLRKRRWRCLHCGKVFTEPDPAFGLRRRSSHRYRQHLAHQAAHQAIRQVARQEQVSEGLVRRSFAEEIGRKVGGGKTVPYTPEYLGIDEFAVRKGRLFHTAVSDLGDKKVVGVEPGHNSQALCGFLNRLPEPDEVRAAVMDMHEPYRQAVELCCPQAAIVADKFHVIRRVNQALDQRRVKVQGQLQEGRRSRLFHSRYLLLKSREGLSGGEQAKVERMLEEYPVLRVAWELKEAFRAMYRASGKVEGARCLAEWTKQVHASGLEEFKRLLSMVARWGREILNYFDHRLTNGYVEGKNNRIKVIKRVAYGYRNVEVFIQRILLTNEALPRPKALKFKLHTY